jgi:hypothetical protein
MISTWINVARSVFNAGKIWVSDDPDYVEIREAIKADFQQNVVNAFKEGYCGPPKQNQVLFRKLFKIALYVLLTAILLSMISPR